MAPSINVEATTLFSPFSFSVSVPSCGSKLNYKTLLFHNVSKIGSENVLP